MKIGRRLLKPEARADRRLIKELSRWLEVTPKTLRHWRTLAEGQTATPAARIGRPTYTHSQQVKAMELVAHELKQQGHPGWRPIAKALPELPTRLVQRCVAQFKKRKRVRARSIRQENRINTQVLAREAIWTLDGTMLGRDQATAKRLEAQVIKDRATLAYRGIRSGAPASTADVMALFERLKDNGQALPLVCATDNGSIYCSEAMQEFFAREKVVHLRSLPRTPEHNGAIEVAIKALKSASEHCGESVEKMAALINKNRLHGSKQFKSSSCLDEELGVAYTKVSRDVFYEKCKKRLKAVAGAALCGREKRSAEREVIFKTLEEYGLIIRTRSDRPYVTENVEVFL